jgi:hypothetical protein
MESRIKINSKGKTWIRKKTRNTLRLDCKTKIATILRQQIATYQTDNMKGNLKGGVKVTIKKAVS